MGKDDVNTLARSTRENDRRHEARTVRCIKRTLLLGVFASE